MLPPAGGTRILGIDPGLRITGYGIIDIVGQALTYVASGRITTDEKTDLPARLRTILAGLHEVIDQGAPMQVAVEKVFVNVNPQSTLLLGQARGAAICAAVLRDLPVAEYTAMQVKQAVVGNGHAKKEQVQEMVKRLLRLPGVPSPDAADALACAICHAHARTMTTAAASQSPTQSPVSALLGARVRRGRMR